MTDGRKPRTLLVPDHLWQAFEKMAAEMGNDRDGLINQALFAFARQHGYLPGAAFATDLSADDAEVEVELEDELGPAAAKEGGPAKAAQTTVLVLSVDGREVDRVIKPRFVIGRGKHCDLVISSGKVSREHAAITREVDGWFIEDLGSSNGTWFEKRRITRRRIEEGDEYLISSERLRCSFQ